MAKRTRLQPLFLGTNRAYEMHILNAAESAAINIAAFALSFRLKRYPTDLDSASLVHKTLSSGITISGAFNADKALNAQRATVSIAAADTSALAAGWTVWELKRTNPGFEEVLAYGSVELVRGVHMT